MTLSRSEMLKIIQEWEAPAGDFHYWDFRKWTNQELASYVDNIIDFSGLDLPLVVTEWSK